MNSRNAMIWAVTLFSVAVLIARTTDAVTYPQLIAEDGYVFFAQAKTLGASALFTPSAGQLHLFQRLVALAASPLPSSLAPAAYLLAALLGSGWAAITIASCQHRHAPIFACLLFLVPHSGECFSTLTNVHWILHIALGFVLLTPSPVSRAVRFNQIALVLITALSGPGIIILSPIALWRAYEHRDIHSRALAGIATVGAAVQTTISILNPFSWGGIGGQPFNLMAFIIDRSLGALSMPLNDGVPVINLAIALAVVTVAVITAWVRSERTLLLGMWFFCAAEMAATYARLYPVPHMAHYPVMWDRYYYIPHYVVLFSLVFAILQLRPARVLAAAGCLALFVGFRPSFMWEKLTVPHLEWAAAARQIDQGTPVDVEINPAGGKARVVLPLK